MARIAVVHREKCNPVECGNYLCMRFCPVNRMGRECIVIGDDKKVNIGEELCTGCGICVKKCPFGALSIINLPAELDETPIHQYGENGFRLYSLPTPVFGKVVGILGRNGIGKSTAVRILAQVLKPNMGGSEEADISKVIGFFKGTEAQSFFEKVRDKKIKVSYKLQAVDLIPKKFSGKVRDLLKNADEKNQLKKVVEELELNDILDNSISDVSGGELQRVAVAACSLKKANLYIFDEPSSYLDIKQRIKVSRFIRGLAGKDTAVIVVEHDMIILDYMADLIHVMYGEESCYGVVSLPKATRTGINVYLSGYLKEENVRFRDRQIVFPDKPPAKRKQESVFVSWNMLKKRLGSFSLSSDKGELQRKQITGVLGENGTGKTTFVKILSGVIKSDSGEISKKISVSYKPQYLSSDSEAVVASVLRDAAEKFDVQIIRPLGLRPLMAKKISELSGGELQRVAVAACLSKEADLYLLDEPSAYLDVEQRLSVSKVIRELMEQNSKTAVVVDHDLLFIDCLSTEIMVFSGKPAVRGVVDGPFSMEEGMNTFLKGLSISLRRDAESRRPRINKLGSQMDRRQKEQGKLYYL